jgi:uncharacterized protein
MIVALVRIRLHIPAARSLKDRRAVVRKAVDRVRARFNVSASEVGDLERWQIATLAAALVTNDRAFATEVLDKLTATIASAVAGEAMILHRETLFETYNDDEPVGDADGMRERDDDHDDGEA